MCFGDPVLLRGAEAVCRIGHHIQRQADGKITAQCGVHRNQRTLHRLIQRGVVAQYAIDNRLTVLTLTNLEIRRVVRGFDEIPLRINVEQPLALTFNLSAEQQIAAEICIAPLICAAVPCNHFTHRFTQQAGGIVKRLHVQQVFPLIVCAATMQQTDNALCGRQISGTLDHQHAFIALMKNMQFTEGGNMVHSGIGA